jgi:hypothetical protein
MTALEKNAEYSALVHPEQSVLFLPESGMHNPLESVFQQANSLQHCVIHPKQHFALDTSASIPYSTQ